jgi:hypothetical protein
MLVVDGKRIIRMTSEGIAYLDEAGLERFVNFADCNERNAQENWEQYSAYGKSHLRFISPFVAIVCGLLAHVSPKQALSLKQKWITTLSTIEMNKCLQIARGSKRVAHRNFTGWPETDRPYFEFYTQPIIRFSFENSEDWSRLRSHIQESGWHSFDFA